LGNTFETLNFEKNFNIRIKLLTILKIIYRIFKLKFFRKFKEKNKTIINNEKFKIYSSNKIISTFRMFMKRKIYNIILNNTKFLQKFIKKFLFEKKIKMIIKMQSLIRK
jgi:hypothetical protein